MEKEKILVVDDDREIADLVRIHLSREGYQVCAAYGGQEAIDLFQRENVVLAILDIMMPGVDGNTVCSVIRKSSTIPIIMLSAKDGQQDKINGLVNGADDYVTKPFNAQELVARVKSQLRRYRNFGGAVQSSPDILELEHLQMNRKSHEVKAYGEDVKLTPIEFDILYLMASNPGQVFSTDEIFEKVWKEDSLEMSNTVMVHIRRIRAKIEKQQGSSQIIKTVWGVGYKIEG